MTAERMREMVSGSLLPDEQKAGLLARLERGELDEYLGWVRPDDGADQAVAGAWNYRPRTMYDRVVAGETITDEEVLAVKRFTALDDPTYDHSAEHRLAGPFATREEALEALAEADFRECPAAPGQFFGPHHHLATVVAIDHPVDRVQVDPHHPHRTNPRRICHAIAVSGNSVGPELVERWRSEAKG